jgi:polyisoprenoid-binding protein YceI
MTSSGHSTSRVVSVLSGLLVLLWPAASRAEPRTYVVEAGESSFTIAVGRAGLFKFAGHEHEVVANAFTGEIVADPDDPTRSSVVLTFDAAGVKLTGKGEPPEDVPKVQETMVGPRALDVARFPKIVFRSSAVKARPAPDGRFDVQVTGDPTLRDVTRPVALDVKVETRGDALVTTGGTVLRHTDFGLRPIAVAGVVKVKNELPVSFHIVAHARR